MAFTGRIAPRTVYDTPGMATMSRLELVGLPGAGKTALATKVGRDEFFPVLEQYRDNPFWATAIAGSSLHWFAADMVFHLLHMAQFQCVTHETRTVIADFSIWQDAFYADRRQSPEQRTIYDKLHQYVNSTVGEPIGYIFLDVPAQLLVARIKERARTEEQKMFFGDLSAAVVDLRAAVQTKLIGEGKTVLVPSGTDIDSLARQVKHFMSSLKARPKRGAPA